MSTAQGDWDDQHRNHELAPKEAETAEPMNAEERTIGQKLLAQYEIDIIAEPGELAAAIDLQIRQAEQAARAHERRKALEEAANEAERHYKVGCHSTQLAISGQIRALANSSEPGEDT